VGASERMDRPNSDRALLPRGKGDLREAAVGRPSSRRRKTVVISSKCVKGIYV